MPTVNKLSFYCKSLRLAVSAVLTFYFVLGGISHREPLAIEPCKGESSVRGGATSDWATKLQIRDMRLKSKDMRGRVHRMQNQVRATGVAGKDPVTTESQASIERFLQAWARDGLVSTRAHRNQGLYVTEDVGVTNLARQDVVFRRRTLGCRWHAFNVSVPCVRLRQSSLSLEGLV